MLILLLIIFLSAFIISLVATLVMKKVAIKCLFLDIPSGRKQHLKPIPLGGGVAIVLGVMVPIIAGVLASYIHREFNTFSFLPTEIIENVGGVFTKLPSLVVILSGGLVILVLGLVDDRKGLSPWFKLLIETIVAIGLVLGGQRLSLFIEGDISGNIVSSILTVLWILLVTNSFNLLDHIDGLCSGVAVVVSIAFLIISIETGQLFIALLLTAILGSTVSFLLFNFHPAKIFLGDAGSLFIGYILASLTISFTFYEGHYSLYSFFVPLVVLAVPLFDTIIVVLIRLKENKNIFEGDRNHFAHRLVDFGMSIRGAVLIIYALTLTTGLSAILLYQVKLSGALIILAQLILVLVIITLLEFRGRKGEYSK